MEATANEQQTFSPLSVLALPKHLSMPRVRRCFSDRQLGVSEESDHSHRECGRTQLWNDLKKKIAVDEETRREDTPTNDDTCVVYSLFDDSDDSSERVLLETRLACGACGEVWRGTYAGEKVAVKIVGKAAACARSGRVTASPDQVAAAESSVTFIREAAALKRVAHPNVVALRAAVVQDGTRMLVLELIDGPSLHEELHGPQAAGPPAVREAVETLRQVADAMAHVHAAGVLHRDLKAGNVVRRPDGSVCLVDFGLSRDAAPGECDFTGEAGSHQYTAPEVLRCERYGQPADVYSFAVLAWELLTGELPYRGFQPVAAAFAVACQGLRPGPLDALPPALAALVRECWAEEPAARPPFDAVLARLHAFLAALPPGPPSARPAAEAGSLLVRLESRLKRIASPPSLAAITPWVKKLHRHISSLSSLPFRRPSQASAAAAPCDPPQPAVAA